MVFWQRFKKGNSKVVISGYWIMVAGLCLIIPGDAIHTMTWHQNGLTIPTPGTNPLANNGYAAAMMGMNFVIIGSLILGIGGLRKKVFAPWLAYSFILITPFAVILSLTLLPTAPSGGLWWFSLLMIAIGYLLVSDRRGKISL